jgi:flagellar hook protein FlgE
MSLFNTLATGASGLSATGAGLAVIGDNIANMNTNGYKKGRAQFEDMLPQSVGTRNGISMMGRGVSVGGIGVMHLGGALKPSGSALDMAISGTGFYEVSDGENYSYTRDGSFHVDKDNYLVNNQGMRVQGYGVVDGTVVTQVNDLQLDMGPISQSETTSLTLDATLSAEAEYLSATGATVTPYAGLTLDGSAAGASIKEASDAADYSTSVTVYDSLGLPRDVTVFFERTGTNNWSWSAVTDGGAIEGATVPDDEGQAFEVSSGTLEFDGDGKLTSMTEVATGTAWNWPGAEPFSFNLELGLDPTSGDPIDGQIKMVGSDSFTTTIAQDGYPLSNITNVQVDRDGSIMASYYNGEQRKLGQVGVAIFPSQEGLRRAGGNLFVPTRESGTSALGPAGKGGRGDIIGYATEGSNVDMEEEFVGMIQTQRTYQANAGVIRSSDSSLQVLVNLV